MKHSCTRCWLFAVSALAFGWNLGQITARQTSPPPPVVVVRQEIPPPPIVAVPEPPVLPSPTIKVCTLSESAARSRCPVTREIPAGEAAPYALCEEHAKVCPVDGKPKSLIDRNSNNQERMYCEDHGARLIPVD
jgi:hypothetical protein